MRHSIALELACSYVGLSRNLVHVKRLQTQIAIALIALPRDAF